MLFRQCAEEIVEPAVAPVHFLDFGATLHKQTDQGGDVRVGMQLDCQGCRCSIDMRDLGTPLEQRKHILAEPPSIDIQWSPSFCLVMLCRMCDDTVCPEMCDWLPAAIVQRGKFFRFK